jgi:putative ABC transport system permease protein
MHPFGNYSIRVDVVGAAGSDAPETRTIIHQVNPGYIRAMGIPLVAGRIFDESETAARRQLAVVNQAFVRRRLAGRSPLGAILRIPEIARLKIPDDSFQVIGVVKDVLNDGVTREIAPEIYFPYTVTGMPDELIVLTHTAPAALANAVRAQVYALDPDQPVMDVQTMDKLLNERFFSRPRFSLVLFAVFAFLGLALAVIGVYGVISAAVTRQTHEIGVRMALGAQTAGIAVMVLRRGALLIGIGTVIGLAASLAAVRVLSGQIWRLSTFDPLVFAAAALLLFIVGLQACIWPARRAARVEPASALRYE